VAAALKTFYADSVVHLWSLSKFLTFVDNNWLPAFRKLGPDGTPLVTVKETPDQTKAREARQRKARETIRAALVGLTDAPKKQTELFQAVADSAAELANTPALPQGMQAAAQTWAKQAHLLLQATKAWACAYDSCKCRIAEMQFGNLALACRQKVRINHCVGNACPRLSKQDYHLICPQIEPNSANDWNVRREDTVQAPNVVLDLSALDKVQNASEELQKQAELGGGGAPRRKAVLSRHAHAVADLSTRAPRDLSTRAPRKNKSGRKTSGRGTVGHTAGRGMTRRTVGRGIIWHSTARQRQLTAGQSARRSAATSAGTSTSRGAGTSAGTSARQSARRGAGISARRGAGISARRGAGISAGRGAGKSAGRGAGKSAGRGAGRRLLVREVNRAITRSQMRTQQRSAVRPSSQVRTKSVAAAKMQRPQRRSVRKVGVPAQTASLHCKNADRRAKFW
jgi:hypothetical protein